MQASELIQKLQALVDEHGDWAVKVYTDFISVTEEFTMRPNENGERLFYIDPYDANIMLRNEYA